MKKLILFFIAFTFCALQIKAQMMSHKHGYNIGNGSNEYVRSIVADSNGDYFVVGEIVTPTDMNPLGGASTLVPDHTMGSPFIAKYDSTGAIIAKKTFSPAGYRSWFYDVELDASGNVYLLGALYSASNYYGTDVIKLSSDLSTINFYSRIEVTAPSNWCLAYNLSPTPDGGAFVMASVRGAIDVGPDTAATDSVVVFSSTRSPAIFKYSSTGALELHEEMTASGGIGEGYDILYKDGLVWVTGTVQGTVDLLGSSVASTGSQDIFIAKYDWDGSSLSYRSHYRIGGTGIDQAYEFEPTDDGHIYLAGRFEGTVDMDFTGGTDSRTSEGGFDGFVVRFDTSGAYDWVVTGGGDSDGILRALWYDPASQHIHVGGQANGSVLLSYTDNMGGTLSYPGSSTVDAVYLQVDPTGMAWQVRSFAGSGIDALMAIGGDANGNVIVGGYFDGNINFDLSKMTTTMTPSAGNRDAFISRFQPVTVITHDNDPVLEEEIAVYPNPCAGKINIDLTSRDQAQLTLVDLNGRVLMQKQISQGVQSLSMNEYPKGLYLLKIVTGDQTQVQRILKQ